MSKLWFKTRRYGWGWTPASIEGWAAIALFLVLLLAGVLVFLRVVRGGGDVRVANVLLLVWIAIVAGGLIAICYAKGEPPRWRWGG